MDAIKNLFEIDIVSITMGIFIIISAFVSIFTIVSKFLEYIGKPLKWVKDKNADHKLVLETASALAKLRNKHEEDVCQLIKHDREIKDDLKFLKEMFVDKEIDDMRWEILDFASAISAGRRFSQEQFDHVFIIYGKYERILQENNMSNGRVTISMELTNEVYKDRLINGF